MKLRADFFNVAADDEGLESIQTEIKKYIKDIEKLDENLQIDIILYTYLQIAMDEGYRRGLEELKKIDVASDKVKILPRKKGVFEYIDNGEEIKNLLPLVRRRINSKRMRNRIKKERLGKGKEWIEEQFVLSMVIHTGWEHGYLKANTVESIVKNVSDGDEEKINNTIKIIKELVLQEDKYLEDIANEKV